MKNRGQLIEIFTSNLANSIIHQVLEKAAFDIPEHFEKYGKEVKNSWQIAKIYREKINPVNRAFPHKDIEEIKNKIINKVNAELNLRILKGYKNISLGLVEEYAEKALKELKII